MTRRISDHSQTSTVLSLTTVTTVSRTNVKNQLNSGSLSSLNSGSLLFSLLLFKFSLILTGPSTNVIPERDRSGLGLGLPRSSRSTTVPMSVKYVDTSSLTSDARSPAGLPPTSPLHELAGLSEPEPQLELLSWRCIVGTSRTSDWSVTSRTVDAAAGGVATTDAWDWLVNEDVEPARMPARDASVVNCVVSGR